MIEIVIDPWSGSRGRISRGLSRGDEALPALFYEADRALSNPSLHRSNVRASLRAYNVPPHPTRSNYARPPRRGSIPRRFPRSILPLSLGILGFLNSWFLEKENGIVSFRRVIVGETDRKESDTIRQECGTRLEIGGNWRGSKIGEKKKVFQSVASPLAGSDGAMVLFCHSKREARI